MLPFEVGFVSWGSGSGLEEAPGELALVRSRPGFREQEEEEPFF